MMLYWLPFLAYLLGSISSAVVVARVMGLSDPRSEGSGNPGATNMLRLGGRQAAAVTLLGDALKGVIPVLIARGLTSDPTLLALVAAGAFLGHLYPLWFGFRGGKGVATAFGVMVALDPWLGAALVGTWVLVALLFRYSSLAALLTAALAPAYTWLRLDAAAYAVMAVGVATLLIWRHRSNIRRLLNGQEDRIRLGRG